MLSHVSALSHSGSSADRKEILGRDGNPFEKSWFEDEPDGATWPRHHMAGGVAVPLKPKTKIVWGKRPQVDDEGKVDPEARSSGQQRTEPAPNRGAGSGKDDDEALPDPGKLSTRMRRRKVLLGRPKPRDTEAGQADPSKITNFSGITFAEYRNSRSKDPSHGEAVAC